MLSFQYQETNRRLDRQGLTHDDINQSFGDSMEEAKRMDYGGMLRYGCDMGLEDDAKEATKDEIKNGIRETNRFIQLKYED